MKKEKKLLLTELLFDLDESLDNYYMYLKKNHKTIHDCYNVFTVLKKNGKERLIVAPNDELKDIQNQIKELFEILLEEYDASNKACKVSGEKVLFKPKDYSFAYETNKSIKDNALMHADGKYFLKLDLRKFFQSISKTTLNVFLYTVVYKYVPTLRYKSLFKSMIESITNICIYKDGLATGSPASPVISNFIMRNLDYQIIAYLKRREIEDNCKYNYSRYADDIVISSDKYIPKEIKKKVKSILFQKNLKINQEKTKYQTNKQKNVVTGLIITPEGKVTVGQKRKKKIKKMMYTYNKDKRIYSFEEINGQLAFIKEIEMAINNNM